MMWRTFDAKVRAEYKNASHSITVPRPTALAMDLKKGDIVEVKIRKVFSPKPLSKADVKKLMKE